VIESDDFVLVFVYNLCRQVVPFKKEAIF